MLSVFVEEELEKTASLVHSSVSCASNAARTAPNAAQTLSAALARCAVKSPPPLKSARSLYVSFHDHDFVAPPVRLIFYCDELLKIG
jgi:hypothetical protein